MREVGALMCVCVCVLDVSVDEGAKKRELHY